MDSVSCKNLKRRPNPAELPGRLIVVSDDDYIMLPNRMREANLYGFVRDAIEKMPKIAAIQKGNDELYVILAKSQANNSKGKKDKKRVTTQQKKHCFKIEHYQGDSDTPDYVANAEIDPTSTNKIFYFETDAETDEKFPNVKFQLELLANFIAFLFIYEFLFPDNSKVREINLKRQSVRDLLDERNLKGISWEGAEVSITRENLSWYRKLVLSSFSATKLEELLSQDKLIMKKMVVDGVEAFEVLKKSDELYYIKYSCEKDWYRVRYDAKNGQVVKVDGSYNSQIDVQDAEKACKDAILIMYYLWATGFEYEEGSVCTLEPFDFFGQMPEEVA